MDYKEFDYKKAKAGALVQTKDGRPVRIVCYLKNDIYPVLAVVTNPSGIEWGNHYDEFGIYYDPKDGSRKPDSDLVMVPTKHTRWGLFAGSTAFPTTFDSKEEADKANGQMVGYSVGKIEWEK